jgi:ABC-type Mn2+/Zn2+ transport system permease subunit
VTRLALRGTALIDAAFGFVLLLGTWDRLYDALNLPLAHEPFYAQMGGAFVVGTAFLLWIAARHASLQRGAALGAALAHVLAAGVAIAWLLDTGRDVRSHSGTTLVLLAAVFGGIAAVDFAIARNAPPLASG